MLDKSITNGREHRKPYYGSKAIDCSCRNHGGCPYCEGNRLYNRKKSEEKLKIRLTEYSKSAII